MSGIIETGISIGLIGNDSKRVEGQIKEGESKLEKKRLEVRLGECVYTGW